MTTHAAPDPQGAPPADTAAPVVEQPAGPPRDDSGRFTTQPGHMPPAPPSGVDPQAAVAYYEAVANPAMRDQALEQTLRQYGYVPDGVTIDQLREAAQLVASLPQGVPLEELRAYADEFAAYQQNPFGQQDPNQGQGAQPFDPAQLQDWVDRRAQQIVQQELSQRDYQQQLGNFQSSLAGEAQRIAAETGLPPAIIENTLLGAANAHLGRGGQPTQQEAARLAAEIQQGFAGFSAMQAAGQMASQQQVVPQTQPAAGAPQGGNPYQPGLQGSAQRAREIIDQMKANGEL